MDSHVLLGAQRALRQRLLEQRAVRASDAAQRDLAAHLLLYLDDPKACWRIGLAWLRQEMDVDRVDGGFCAPSASTYQACAESLRQDRAVPTILDTAFDVNWPGIRTVLQGLQPVFVPSVDQAASLGEPLRRILQCKGTCTKLAMPLQGEHGAIGVVCADWLDPQAGLDAAVAERFQSVVAQVLSPVLNTALALSDASSLVALQRRLGVSDDALTPAEWRVAHLVAMGMSYKEIARQLGRSFSTVDHQLRSIRGKLDVPSTAKLVSMLATPRSSPTLTV